MVNRVFEMEAQRSRDNPQNAKTGSIFHPIFMGRKKAVGSRSETDRLNNKRPDPPWITRGSRGRFWTWSGARRRQEVKVKEESECKV